MSIHFRPLFEVEVAHGYYAAPTTDIAFDVPAVTPALAAGKLLARIRHGRLVMLFEADEAGLPLRDIGGQTLLIGLNAVNPYLANFTEAPVAPGSLPLFANRTQPRSLDTFAARLVGDRQRIAMHQVDLVLRAAHLVDPGVGGDAQRLLRTVQRRGYRFDSVVTGPEKSNPDAAKARPVTPLTPIRTLPMRSLAVCVWATAKAAPSLASRWLAPTARCARARGSTAPGPRRRGRRRCGDVAEDHWSDGSVVAEGTAERSRPRAARHVRLIDPASYPLIGPARPLLARWNVERFPRPRNSAHGAVSQVETRPQIRSRHLSPVDCGQDSWRWCTARQ